ncbi:MAG TPA: APC family permease [Candidatus Binataceae bacterium]|nr:APC family permease [Candidatus Binataceae bacterium]
MEAAADYPSSNDKRTLVDILIGPARNIHDPDIFHHVSLIAFLAWVGLGSDGLSSSCYGPEEAFIALGTHQYLAVFLALMTALTVLIISSSYSQTIDLFPTGGGGYLVASKLLGQYPGLVSGCALVIDYVLTISISIASGADAIFSFLPMSWLNWKPEVCLAMVVLMVLMNLRGVKESVLTLVPIFISFVVLHVFMIGYALVSRASELPAIGHDAIAQVRGGMAELGALPLLIIFLRAYSLGGGTYTGIEAVSNGLPILREPRTVTGKRTMAYMALSLAFIAGGILIGYLLLHVTPERGKTLNAVLFSRLASHWYIAGIPVGIALITFTLITEGALLFVAAQTGFIDGPRVLATMATDRWLPRRFSNLSARLVIQDGIMAIGFVALLVLVATRADVDLLVVLYAINVFVTFTLSQLGMSAHWWSVRDIEPRWAWKLLINGVGCAFTAVILIATITLKFHQGGWVTVLMTGALIAICIGIRRHYDRIGMLVEKLEIDILPQLFAAEHKPRPGIDNRAPTAVLLVNGFNGLGLATLVTMQRLFNSQFRNLIFLAVTEVDAALFKGRKEIEAIEREITDDLQEYCKFAADLGFHSELRAGLGTDVVSELGRLCLQTTRDFPHSVFFAGKLVFENAGFFSRFFHNHTALDVQAYLERLGLSLVILPVRVIPHSLN